MSSECSVTDEVKELINDIIFKNNWKLITDVKYYPGSEAGEGYASKHVCVEINAINGIFRLFVKYCSNVPIKDLAIESFYANEIYFYNVVYPAFSKFLEERHVEKGLGNIAECFGTSGKNVIALENLKYKGFTLFDGKKTMDERHISLALKTFAKFHAVSYAFKDQDRKKYEEFKLSTPQDFLMTNSKGKDSPLINMLKNLINHSLRQLNPEMDKYILENFNVNDVVSPITDVKNYLNEYSILIQGDCWCNNIMFLYDKEVKENPIDIVLVDWQLLREGSPVFDISYFFYSIANEQALSKLHFYLREYYSELFQQIKCLGSDPDRLYPFSVFEKEWKSHCKYGFGMAFMLVKFMLATVDEAPKFTDVELEELSTINLFPKFNNQVEYCKRMRMLCEFMIDNDYI